MIKESKANEVDSYQEELSNAVDDGGGCYEAWETAQVSRMGSRRSFMTGVVASLLTGASIGSISAAETISADPEKEISELTKTEKQQLVKEARSDTRVQAIQREHVSRGLKPDSNSVVGYKTTYQDRELRFVRIPFSTNGSSSLRLSDDGDVSKTGSIIWNTAEEIDPYGYVTTYQVDYTATPDEIEQALRENGVSIDSIDTAPVVTDYTHIGTNGRTNVNTNSNSVTLPIATEREITAQGCECSSAFFNPITACAPCGVPDGECMNDLANVYALEIVACGSCVATSGWLTKACAACVATIIEENQLGFTCCPCRACDGIIIC